MIPIADAKNFWDSQEVALMVEQWKSDPDKARHERMIAKVIGNVKKVADVGCGAGRFSQVVQSPGYVGFDGSMQMLYLAEQNNPGKLFVNVDIFNFQPDDHYSVVMLIDVAQHQVEPIEAVKRIMKLWKANRYIFTFVVGTIREDLLMTTVEPFRNYLRFLEEYKPKVHAMEKCLDGDFAWVLLEVVA